MIHAHLTSWALALILLIIGFVVANKGNEKATKIIQMILRVTYLLIIGTGIYLFVNAPLNALYYVKGIAGLLAVSAFEILLIRKVKGKPVGAILLLLVIAFGAAIYLGFYLPMGSKLF
ncbi:DUF1516 family protein [Bacillus kwashiorkori]|uniref:DUF1516 family protein n=1 Tax=Bacillus kwashiorkori TaxID=1522318 RepID=UPI000785A4CA|nr:DUF1516 family protein [Bacillus kwashiorkori]